MNESFFELYGKVARLQTALTGTLGVLCMLAPGLVLSLFGAVSNAAAETMMRAFGASVIFVATVSLLTRDTRDRQTALAVSIANVVEDGLLSVLTLMAVLAGTFSAMGWILVAVFAGEVVLNAYVISRAGKPGERSST